MEQENSTEYVEEGASDTRKEYRGERDITDASTRSSIEDRTPRLTLAFGDSSSDSDHENDCKQRGTGQDGHGHDSVGQVHDERCPETQARGSRGRRAQNRHASDDDGCGSRREDNGKSRDDVDEDDGDPAVRFRVAAGGRTDARPATTAGRLRRQAVVATSSKTTEGSQPEKRTSAIDDASEATSRARSGPRASEGRWSSRSSRKKRHLAVPGGVSRRASAATDNRGRKPRFEETDVPRPASSREEGTLASGHGTSSPVDVSPSSSFLGRASGRSWSTRCSPALFVISVVSAGVFVCMSFQVFSVVRTHGAPEEDWAVQNRTSESTADQAHRAASASPAVAATADDEDFQTAAGTDVE
ncbi:uncharacterized protein LOC125941315 [Dermacentor silvarum]|uniref:uncharacterized protein LOC125941315 n=1 Tax=Dermacentor silvarum TaxID=543639 RepID=UPI002100C5AD|nr:uncharacterized protein LOC125941315 [Dermacentor silvarum]